MPAYGPDKTKHIDITFYEFNDEDAENSTMSDSSAFPKPPKKNKSHVHKKNKNSEDASNQKEDITIITLPRSGRYDRN